MKRAFPCIVALGAALAPAVCAQNAADAPLAANEAAAEIIIDASEKDGELVVSVDGKVVTRDQLAELLKRAVSVNPNRPVRIRGEADMRWQKVADVISTCTRAGVSNVSFSKQMPKEEK